MVEPKYVVVPGIVDGFIITTESGRTTPTNVRNGDLVEVSGWLLDGGVAIAQAWILLDGEHGAPVEFGLPRPDLVQAGYPRSASSGFIGFLLIDGIEEGEHSLIVEAVDIEGKLLRSDGKPFSFEVVSAGGEDKKEPIAMLENVWVDGTLVEHTAPVRVSTRNIIKIRGWIIDADRSIGLAAFLILGDRLLPLSYGVERPDVAEAYGAGATLSGFIGTFDGAALGNVPCNAKVALLADDGASLLHTRNLLQITPIE